MNGGAQRVRFPDGCLVVFARAPRPGRVKTRLHGRFGKRGAARLHAALLRHTVDKACAVRVAPVQLWCDPDVSHPVFAGYRREYGVSLRAQPRGDLGMRMYRVCRRVLREASMVILIGNDCPALTLAHLNLAMRRLAEGDEAVFSPAEDGGYALIGLRRVDVALFHGIAWGGPRVMAQTARRLRRMGWRWSALPTVWDVDLPGDVMRLRREMPGVV